MTPIQQYIEALESGRYKQGYGQLRTLDDKFCVLGVLCDVAVRAGIIDEPNRLDGEYFKGYQYGESVVFPPFIVRSWLGGIRIHNLIFMNDEKHNRFKTIANYLKENNNV